MSAPTALSRPPVEAAPAHPSARRPGTAVAATVAVLLGTLALDPVFASRGWLPPVAAAVLVVGLGGAVLRGAAARLAGADRPARAALGITVPAVQALLVLCLLTAGFAAERSFAGFLPTWSSLDDLGAVLADGRAEILEQATPALPLTGLVALTTVFVALIALAVDLLVVAGRQAALGGLGLLVLYCVPVSTITGDLSLVSFLAPAAGFAVLLWADQRDRLATGARAGSGSPLGTGTLAALRTGVLALVAGVLLPVVVPTLGEGSLAGGLGSGTGGGSSTGSSLDPVAELRGELLRPEPMDLLEVDASVDDPGYLRAVTLDRYDGEGWRLSNLDGEQSIAVAEPLAPLPDRAAGRPVTATITATGHDDQFLPTFSAPQSIDVQGDEDAAWRFDPENDTVFGRDVTTEGRSWTVTAVQPGPGADDLATAGELRPGDRFLRRYTELPPLDPSVTALVDELTDPGQSPYQRVRAINDHLTDRGNGFIYSLSTEPGTSGDDLVDFLQLKRGYCEQYAGAMGVLVRAAGVPARVVLGYTPGERTGDGPRVVTSDDAHAWVEAWFAGFGWVPFDPTPIGVTRAVPLEWAPRADATVDAASAPVAPGAPAPPPTVPGAELDRDDQFTPLALPENRSGDLVSWATGAGGTLLVLLLAAAPWAVRRRQRAVRLADGSPGALWDELLATTTDLGIAVPSTRTPRALARQLAELVSGVDPAAVPAVRELALAEERSVYGPPGATPTPPPREALGIVRRGLLGTVSRRQRIAAALWPASTVGAAAQWVVARLPGRPRSA
ncbi:transglutaminase TgpA family protein [Modestobacter lapidis]|nr:transglutaminase domain-containing protein [Modestobacter lapidis]